MAKDNWVYNDGGRVNAGYASAKGDCAIRAISVATGIDYRTVLAELTKRDSELANNWGMRKSGKSLTDIGVLTSVSNGYLTSLGWEFVRLYDSRTKLSSLPKGTIIIDLPKHLVCAIDNVLQDTWNSFQRARYVMGYWFNPSEETKESAMDMQSEEHESSPTMPLESQERIDATNRYNEALATLLSDQNITTRALTALQENQVRYAVSYAVIKLDGNIHGMPIMKTLSEIVTDIENAKERGYSYTLDYALDPRDSSRVTVRDIFMLKLYASELAKHYNPMHDPDPEDMPEENDSLDTSSSDICLTDDTEEITKIDVHSLKITHSNRVPVTMVSPNRATNRVVRYCVVKTYKRNPLMGKIKVNGESRKVTRRILSNGQYSQWELL